MNSIPVKSEEFEGIIQEKLGNASDLHFEVNGKITVAFLTTFTKKAELQDNFLNPIHRWILETPYLTWEKLLAIIPESGRVKRTGMAEAILDLLNGYTLVHLSGRDLVYSFDTHRELQREPKEPQVERTIRGTKISFVETIADNLLMIRRNIRDESLRIDQKQLGRRTKNKIAVVYLQDVASPRVVREVHRRLDRIEIDGIVDSGYIEQLISDNRLSIFPLTQSTERPDKAISGILEGRVAILADGSSNAIIVPVTVNELYQSPEDYFFPFWFGCFLRFFRILGNNIAVALPGLYIALGPGSTPNCFPSILC